MAEKLRDVINRMKTQQNSQASKSVQRVAKPLQQGNNAPMPLKQAIESDLDEEYGEYNDKEEFEMNTEPETEQEVPVRTITPKVERPVQQFAPRPVSEPVEKPVETGIDQVSPEQIEQIVQEIELLQNNGRYRVELLHQLQEINKALVVIAGVLVDLSGNGNK